MQHFLSILQGTLAVVITFGLAVFVHEFGHMMFALIRGVGVESFAIGMGPKITSWKWRGIDFSLRWLPVGGFVKLQPKKPEEEPGMGGSPVNQDQTTGEPPVPQEAAADEKSLADSSYDDLFALQDKGFVTKVMVFGGGVFMNLVTAILATALLFWIGQNIPVFGTTVEKLDPKTELAKSGLQPGDKIVAVDGKPVKYMHEMDNEMIGRIDDEITRHHSLAWRLYFDLFPERALKNSGEDPKIAFKLTVQRAGKDVTVPLPPLDQDGVSDLISSFWRPTVIVGVSPNQPADKAGIQLGDRIVAINGKPVDSFRQMSEGINANGGKPIEVAVKRGTEIKKFTMTPRQGIKGVPGESSEKAYIGVVPGSDETIKDRIANPVKALALAPLKTAQTIVQLIAINVEFFKNASFKQVRENVTGPIGIAALTAKISQGGIAHSINFFITLNLLLMIFNLLPIPVLDGGFILLAVIEGIVRRPVPPKVLAPIYTVFMVGLIILMVLISMQDVVNWILPRFH